MVFHWAVLLFVYVNQLDHLKDTSHLDIDALSASGVNLTLFAPKRAGHGAGLSVRFRLSNQGDHSVFYPIRKTTKQLIGQVAGRTSLPENAVIDVALEQLRLILRKGGTS